MAVLAYHVDYCDYMGWNDLTRSRTARPLSRKRPYVKRLGYGPGLWPNVLATMKSPALPSHIFLFVPSCFDDCFVSVAVFFFFFKKIIFN